MTRPWVLWLMFALAVPSLAQGRKAMLDQRRQLKNRRDQARKVFLATPRGIYSHYCAHCHGDDAKGSGRLWASGLEPLPADLTRSKLDQAGLAKFITNGSAAAGRSSLCPPWGRTISPPNIERLAGHIAALGGRTPAQSKEPSNQQPPKPAGESFPWLLAALLPVELLLLAWLLLRSGSRKVTTPPLQTTEGEQP